MPSSRTSMARLAAAIIVAIGLASCSPSSDSFQLGPALEQTNASTYWVSGVHEITDVVCPRVGCVEAWWTDQATYLRFESHSDAEHFAIGLGDDGHSDRYLVVDFTEQQPSTWVRTWAIDWIESWNRSG